MRYFVFSLMLVSLSCSSYVEIPKKLEVCYSYVGTEGYSEERAFLNFISNFNDADTIKSWIYQRLENNQKDIICKHLKENELTGEKNFSKGDVILPAASFRKLMKLVFDLQTDSI